jgi:hypothetical protein
VERRRERGVLIEEECLAHQSTVWGTVWSLMYYINNFHYGGTVRQLPENRSIRC